jgi:hypothetical protein
MIYSMRMSGFWLDFFSRTSAPLLGTSVTHSRQSCAVCFFLMEVPD